MPINDSAGMPLSCFVVESWVASYPDPIQARAGDALELDGREDLWDGHRWLWAKHADGKEGWVPDAIASEAHPFTATETYSALELSCTKGQALTALRVLHGWVWCLDEAGQRGWVPLRNLEFFEP